MGRRTVYGFTGLGAAAALGLGVAIVSPARSGEAEDALHIVRRGDLRITLVENGVLQAKHSAQVVSLARRGGKIMSLVEEGTVVEEGDVLCELDATPLIERLQERRLEVVQTEADLNTAQTELEIQKSENAANIEKTKMALDKARKEYERYTDGDAPQERTKLTIAIKEAETTLSIAEEEYEQAQKLYEKGFIASAQLRQDRVEHEKSIDELALAKRDLEIFEEFTFPMTLKEKEVAVRDAERESANAALRAQAMLRQKEVAVESAEERLRQLRQQIESIEEEIGHFTIRAPVPGVVIYGDPGEPWTRNYVQVGRDVWGGITLFTIPDLREMQARVQVHETDIDKIRPGQRAAVTMDTYPGLFLEGEVTRVANLATGASGDGATEVEVREFSVEIDLDSTKGRELKPGVSAKAEIFIEDVRGAVYVPVQCVFEEEGAMRVLVAQGEGEGAPRRRAVRIGPANDQFVQIVEGLEPGERVLLYNPSLPGAQAPEDDDAHEPPAALPASGAPGTGGV